MILMGVDQGIMGEIKIFMFWFVIGYAFIWIVVDIVKNILGLD